MRTCHRFPVPAFALFVMFGCSFALAGPIALAPSPSWQIETGVADWLDPATGEIPLAPLTAAAFRSPAPVRTFAPVQLLTRVANGLRDIRYRRGGRSPTTGFDCSGFVRYVFQQGVGAELPNTSAAQFQFGHAVERDQLRSGDLVFFRTRGKRVSHVGIYLGEGRFIHAPSSGKTVGVSSLSERYWSQRFAGARRADVLLAGEVVDPQING